MKYNKVHTFVNQSGYKERNECGNIFRILRIDDSSSTRARSIGSDRFVDTVF